MLRKEIVEEAEFAKSRLMSSSLDDRVKKPLLRLLNTATIATNGISTEEKIQKITETIQGLVMSQITFMDTIDQKIEVANKKHCETCKAMKYTQQMEQEKEQAEIIQKWKYANGIHEEDDQRQPEMNSLMQTIMKILTQPYCWVFFSILAIAPNGVDMIRVIVDAFSK